MPVLLSPDQRLLGWALSDLTLYGGQPPAGLTIGAPRDAAVFAPPPSAATADPAGSHPSDPQALTPTFTAGDDDSLASVALSPAGPAPLAPEAFHTDPAAFTPAVPADLGSGSAVQPIVVTPLAAVSAGHDGLDRGDLSITTSSTQPAAIDALAHATAPIAATVTDLAAPVLAPIEGVATHPDALVTTTVDTIAAAATPVASGLEGLGGSDPAAGVHTLIGMVENADAFTLGHVTAPEGAAAPSIVDALAADEAPSPLLGDDHHAAGAAEHLLDGHGGHLGL